MNVVGDLLTRDRRSRAIALVTATGSERSYHDLITNAYKSANVLRYLGAREGSTVAIDPDPGIHSITAFLGAARLGARVRFDPAEGVAAGDRIVFVPVGDEERYHPDPGTNLVTYGGPPTRPETTHWEKELWSENPGTPPATVGADDPLFVMSARETDETTSHEEREVSHATAIEAADRVVTAHDLTADSRVVLRTSLVHPGAVVAGVLAPLVAGGSVVLTASERTKNGGEKDRQRRGDLAVVADPEADGSMGSQTVPEPRRVTPPPLW
ncbi:acyl-CoA synthetase family protein [Halorubrum vacuolatum]|uniref:AMP-binding enzyme n=1 Tax=Halorubrum vacuolatum TaxID=63740 RepID=A0A238WZ85_HALVU|nr:AMP-binding protein [Halorubrum vacuolatum]SNR51681.1 AMP-binding enzyme [Halorubrum vacuolatum]